MASKAPGRDPRLFAGKVDHVSTLFENQAVRALRKIGHLMVAG